MSLPSFDQSSSNLETEEEEDVGEDRADVCYLISVSVFSSIAQKIMFLENHEKLKNKNT